MRRLAAILNSYEKKPLKTILLEYAKDEVCWRFFSLLKFVGWLVALRLSQEF